MLLSHGANGRDTDACRGNALYYALRYGDGEMIECMLQAVGE